MEAELPDSTVAIVVAIDPTTNRVVAQTDIPGTVIVGSTGHPRIVVGAGAVWSLHGDQLTKFDPQTAAVAGNVRLDGQYFDGGIVASDTGVWLVGVPILAVDPSSMETREIATVEPGYIQSSTIDGDTIWLTEAHGGGGRDPVIELVRIDTTTGEVTYTGVPTYNVVAGQGRVWFQGFAGLQVSDTHSGYAVEVDPATHQMLRAAAIDLAAIHASTPRRRPVGPVAPPRHPTDTRPRVSAAQKCVVHQGDGCTRNARSPRETAPVVRSCTCPAAASVDTGTPPR